VEEFTGDLTSLGKATNQRAVDEIATTERKSKDGAQGLELLGAGGPNTSNKKPREKGVNKQSGRPSIRILATRKRREFTEGTFE